MDSAGFISSTVLRPLYYTALNIEVFGRNTLRDDGRVVSRSPVPVASSAKRHGSFSLKQQKGHGAASER